MAMRQGSMAAASPPGNCRWERWPRRLQEVRFGQENFTAPDRPVGAKTGAVHDYGKDRVRETMFGHDRYGMGMVMLDAVQGQRELFGIAAAQVIGMQIAGHGLGFDFKDPLQVSIDSA